METLTITPNDELLMLDVPIALREPTVKELYLVQYPNKIGEDAWTETVRGLIEKAGPLPMHAIVNYVTHYVPNDKWPSRGVLLDYIYATIERACRAANLEPVWRIYK